MKVDALKAQANQNRQDLKKLIRSQRGEIAARQQELKNIEKIYDKKKEDKRFQGEVELMDVAERNEARLIQASQGKEEKLAEMKTHIQETQERLMNEEIALKKANESKIKDLNTRHSVKASDIFERSQEELKDLNYNTNKKIKEVEHGTNQELTKIRHKTKLAVDKAAYENDLKVTDAQNGQASALKQAEEKFNKMARQQEFDHKNAIAELRMKNQNEYLTRERINKDRTEASRKHYDELVRSEKLAFEEKYRKMIGDNQQVLKRLKASLDKQIHDTVESKAKELKSVETRQEDKFYHLITIEPRLREDEKAYYIDVKTPAHEKENYNLTADKRTIKLSFNRRAEKRLDAPDGTVETSKKSEAITKEFKVSEIVDDREVKVAYKDGVLSYRLPKA